MVSQDRVKQFLACQWFIIQSIYSASPTKTVLLCVVELSRVPLRLVEVWVSKQAIDTIVAAISNQQPSLMPQVVLLVAVGLVAEIATRLLYEVGRTSQEMLGQLTSRSMHRRLLKKSSLLPLEFFESRECMDRLDRAKSAIDFQWVTAVQQSVQMVSSVISVIAWALLLSTYSWWIAPLVLIGWAPGIVLERHFRQKAATFRTSSIPELKKMGYIERIMTERRPVRELVSYGAQHRLLIRYDRLARRYTAELQKMLRTGQRYNLMGSGVSNITAVTTTLLFAWSATMRLISLGDFTMYRSAVSEVRMGLGSLLRDAGHAMERDYMAKAVLDFLNYDLPNTAQGTTALASKAHTIEARDVWFRYPDADEWALKGVSLRINEGEKVAIVGRNGAGKSTLAKVLCGLYQPQRGSVAIDGNQLGQYTRESRLEQVAVVFQDYTVFAFTLKDNIALGQFEDCDIRRVWQCVEQGGLKDVVKGLPAGLDTFLYKEYDNNGQDISGGETQKVAIARAYYKRAGIYVLDEPTSHLDPEAEAMVFRQFNELTAGATSILISHRLSGVVKCDKIVVLDAGSIVEVGTHDELMGLNGLYAQMFRLQAEQYNTHTGIRSAADVG